MTGLSLDVLSDICDLVGAWQDRFLSETSLDRYRRAAAWAVSETAHAAKVGATDALDAAFDNRTPWMRRAFTYKRALTKTGDIVQAVADAVRRIPDLMEAELANAIEHQTSRPLATCGASGRRVTWKA